MGDPSQQQSIIAALTTEHFVMQTAIGTSVNEQQARASMYLFSVSGALVAIGFMARSEHLLLFVAAVLLVLFVAGLLTTMRLVDISMESFQSHIAIARIRGHYRSLGGVAKVQFDQAHGRWPEGKTDSAHIIGPLLGLMTTAASMIAWVNAFMGAALLLLLMVNVLRLGMAISMVAATVFAVGQVIAFYKYQAWRIDLMVKLAHDAGLAVGGDGKGDRS